MVKRPRIPVKRPISLSLPVFQSRDGSKVFFHPPVNRQSDNSPRAVASREPSVLPHCNKSSPAARQPRWRLLLSCGVRSPPRGRPNLLCVRGRLRERHTQSQPAHTLVLRDTRSWNWKVSSYGEPEAVSSDRRSPADLRPEVPPFGETCRALCRKRSVLRSASFLRRP